MHFTIDRNSLLKPLGHIYSVVERRNTIPILSNVLIETNSSKILSLGVDNCYIELVELYPCNSKIELEQNKIFKILTIITVCISLPTLIVGIYGMNFKHMPELKWVLGYPIIVLVLILSFIFPLIYFKRKKWF